MSSITADVSVAQGKTVVLRSWKTPVTSALAGVFLVALLLLAPRPGTTDFNLSTDTDAIQLPTLTVSITAMGIIAMTVIVIMTAISIWLVASGRRASLWYASVSLIFALISFLTWAGVGNTVQVPALLIGTVTLSVPLIFGALGGVVCERSGVVNIAIEGQLLAGAFVSAVVTTMTGIGYVGLFAAAIGGGLVSIILAVFAIKYFVQQVIVGTVINVLISGLTGFLYSTWLQTDPSKFNNPERFSKLPIPFLSDIPLIGPALFNQTIVVYLLYVIIAAVTFALFRTKWGLRTRAVGEHPMAADTLGVRVNRMRFWNVTLGGAIAGLGGAFITIASVGSFGKDMTAGAGFIALAAVIFGQWHPIKATFAALLFGFANSLQGALSIIGSPVPSEFMLMLPYLVTILAVAGLVGKSRAPGADGVPYVKE